MEHGDQHLVVSRGIGLQGVPLPLVESSIELSAICSGLSTFPVHSDLVTGDKPEQRDAAS